MNNNIYIKKNKKTFLKNVLLTDREHEKLIADYGSEIIDLSIKILDKYIESGSKPAKKYRNHNFVIRKWCIKEAQKRLNLKPSENKLSKMSDILNLFKN